MRTMIYLLTFLIMHSANACAESFKTTTSDMYMESYKAQMRRQAGQTAAEIRAEEYRRIYEICDEHHDCSNSTAGSVKETGERKESLKKHAAAAIPFFHTPLFQ